MCVRATMSEGRFSSVRAAPSAASTAATLIPSTCCTCQPYAAKRAPTSSEKVTLVVAERVMRFAS